MGWTKITFAWNPSAYDEIFEAFEAAFIAAQAPTGAALFGRSLYQGETELYFSSVAAQLFGTRFANYEPQPSPRPMRDGTVLLIGHQDAFLLLGP